MSILSIRDEQPSDRDAIRSVLVAAFEGTVEADLVERLRMSCPDQVSLVATLKNVLVGHILFTPARIDLLGRIIEGWALGPMAVHPDQQRTGIGSLMAESGIDCLRQKAAPFVAVLGHSDYYPRFGFERASRWNLRAEWEVPEEAFMILPLERRKLRLESGIVRYHPEFHSASPEPGG
jgi:putative acetyltransferase